MSISEQILQYIQQNGQVSVGQLIEDLKLSRTTLYPHLTALTNNHQLTKIGKPPKKVYYCLTAGPSHPVDIPVEVEAPPLLLPAPNISTSQLDKTSESLPIKIFNDLKGFSTSQKGVLFWLRTLSILFIGILMGYQWNDFQVSRKQQVQIHEIQQQLDKALNELVLVKTQLAIYDVEIPFSKKESYKGQAQLNRLKGQLDKVQGKNLALEQKFKECQIKLRDLNDQMRQIKKKEVL